MAKMPLGLLGPLSGRIGNMIVCNGKYGPYVRSLPKPRTDNPTPTQQLQREKMKLITKFLAALNKLIAVTFHDIKSKVTARNDAFSYILRYAIDTSGPKPAIVYRAVLVSKGNLPGRFSASASVSAPGIIRFDWRDISFYDSRRSTDRAILVVYCESLNSSVYVTNGAARSIGTDSIEVSIFLGYTVQTWMAFISADGKAVASSEYTGELAL